MLSLIDSENFQKLQLLVERNLDYVTTLEEIFDDPNFNSNLCIPDVLHISINKCYLKMRKYKQLAQTKLNLYNSYHEYKHCEVLTYNNLPLFDSLEIEKESVVAEPDKADLVALICQFIKYYRAIESWELLKLTNDTGINNWKINNDCQDNPDNQPKSVNHFGIPKLTIERLSNDEQKRFHDGRISESWQKHGSDILCWSCPQCTYINQGSATMCRVCYSSPDIFLPKKRKESPDKTSVKLSMMRTIVPNEKFFCDTSDVEEIDKFIIPKSSFSVSKMFRYMIFKSKVLTSSDWKCSKCGLLNQTEFCEACLNPSPYIHKWKCERCNCLNKYFNRKCNLCAFTNRNIMNCQNCQTNIVSTDRKLCDRCFCQKLKRKCWYPKCGALNNSQYMFCVKCGIQSSPNFQCHVKIRNKIVPIWLCQFCMTSNSLRTECCKNQKCGKIRTDLLNEHTVDFYQ